MMCATATRPPRWRPACPPRSSASAWATPTFAITMDTYSHVLPGLDEQAAGQVARLIPWVLVTRFRGCFVSKS
jgi:hypothetical protein